MHDRRPLILADGTTARVRASVPGDAALMARFLESLDPTADGTGPLRDRVGRGRPAESLCDSSDPGQRLCIVAIRTLEGEHRIVGAAGYAVTGGGVADVALGVVSSFRGKGLATGLLERLALVAAHHDVRVLRAAAQGNAALIDVLRSAGFPLRDVENGAMVELDLDVVPEEGTRLKSEMRDRLATAASIRPFFHPRAIAVVGASRDLKSLGARTLFSLVMGRFDGPVYAVNPHAASIGPIPAYPSVRELPGPVDLAIVLVPSTRVLDVVDDCAAAGVRAMVVITAGFAETGAAGRELQDALVARVRANGMRMVGPNCMGILNADPDVRMNASFAPVFPPAGHVAMSSQSGALGLAVLATADQLGIGLSSFVSVGNKADVSGNDLLQYWEDDPRTKVILLYVESFGNPRRFARIARRIGRSKPIVAVKSGRTGAGQRAAGSHTAALAGSDKPAQALFRQTGVIRADTMEEMFDLALVLSSQPLPTGRRVAVLTNAGGPGILLADACVANGLEVSELEPATRDAVAALLPPEASVGNPVDMIASAGPEQYQRAAEILLDADEVDALVVIYAPIEAADLVPVEDALERVLATRGTKPVLTCLMGEGGRGPSRALRRGVPSYIFPEAIARVLGKIANYAAWRQEPPGVVPVLDRMDMSAARAVCRRVVAERGEGWLDPDEARDVLAHAGLPITPGAFARTPHDAVAAATELGFPVAIKLASREIIHKTDVGGVVLGVENADGVTAAFDALEDRLRAEGRLDAMDGVWIQPMVRSGVEVMAGMTEDPIFGPVVAFGLGGVHVEVLEDVVFRITPLTERDANEMVRGIRGQRLLQGYRGHPPADLAALEDVLLRISRLADEVPEIDDLDLNPVFAFEPGAGAAIVDARIHVSA